MTENNNQMTFDMANPDNQEQHIKPSLAGRLKEKQAEAARLNDRTPSAVHTDFGEKIGGAKKDLWRSRGLNADDLLEMNAREAEKYVKKDNVWKRDYQKFLDEDVPSDVVYFMKTVRDSISPAPVFLRSDDTDEKKTARQKQYIETVREIQSVVEAVTNKDDAQELFQKYIVDNGYYENRSGYTAYSPTEKTKGNTVITSKLFNAFSHAKNWEWEIKRESEKTQFGVSKEEKIPKGYDIHFYDENAASWTHSQNKEKRELNTYWISYKRGFGNVIIAENIPTREEAVKMIQEREGIQKGKSGKQRFVPPQLENIQREGADYRQGRDIEGQDYIDTFGFKGGEFGNWVNQTERQASLNFGYEALKDLAESLNIADKDVSYNGELSIAFGARGSGTALAHYEPLRKVINLTKMKGAGSLAHEWWHGFDDYLGKKYEYNGLLSAKPRGETVLTKLIETMQYKTETPEEAQKRRDSFVELRKKQTEPILDRVINENSADMYFSDEQVAELRAMKADILDAKPESAERFISKLEEFIKSENINYNVSDRDEMDIKYVYTQQLAVINKENNPQKIRTDFYQNSIDMDKTTQKAGGYWQSREEMSARAFACYLADKLERKSDYLVGHADCAVGLKIDSDGKPQVIAAFPQGEERKAINAAFDSLFEHLKELEIVTHVEHTQDIPAVEAVKTAIPEKQEQTEIPDVSGYDYKNEYRLLSRLQQDCEYFLGNGGRAEKHLWAGNIDGQIAEMKQIWEIFPEDMKPEWLTMEQINSYESKMLNAPEKAEIPAPTAENKPEKAANPAKQEQPNPPEIAAEMQTARNHPSKREIIEVSKTDPLKDITDRLERGVKELYSNDKYTSYLDTISQFHGYSLFNTMLINIQKPDSTLVAGFNAWKSKFERSVNKGEKGIKILAPSPYKVRREVEKKDESTGLPVIKNGKPVTEVREITVPYFKVVSVFDVSQTNGKDLPEIAKELKGKVGNYKEFFKALTEISPVTVEFENMTGDTKGYFNSEERRIAIKRGMSEQQTVKTMIHELAHSKLHDRDTFQNRGEKEVEAESVAYVVCQHYGIDASDYSFGYIAAWSSGKDTAELKSSLEIIRTTAAEIINVVDDKMRTLEKAQEVDMGAEKTQNTNPEKQEQTVKPVDLKAAADYFQKLYDGVNTVPPERADAIFHAVIKRLEQSVERLSETPNPQLSALVKNAAESADMNTLKSRMETLNTEFIQNYTGVEVNMQSENTVGKKNPNIIGNTPYADITDKKYFKMNTELAAKVSAELDAQGIKHSGRINGGMTTLTINTADVDKYIGIVKRANSQKRETPENTVALKPVEDMDIELAKNTAEKFESKAETLYNSVNSVSNISKLKGNKELANRYSDNAERIYEAIDRASAGKHTVEDVDVITAAFLKLDINYNDKSAVSEAIQEAENKIRGSAVLKKENPEKPKAEILGNTAYRDIQDKKFTNVDSGIVADMVRAELDKQGIKFSAKVNDNKKTTFTTSADDADKVKAAVDKVKTAVKEIKSADKAKEQPAKQEANIIGNTQFRFIKDKTYHKLDSVTAAKVAAELEKQGVKFSGKVDGDKTTLTIGAADVEKYNKVAANIAAVSVAPRSETSRNTPFVDKISAKTGQKKLDAMNVYLNSNEISGYAGNKDGFEKASKSFLRQLLKDVGQTLTDKYGESTITESKVSFNPGGIAVAGDPSLYCMTNQNKGLSVYISDSFMRSAQKECILYREISSVKDYKGDNHWLSVNKPYEDIVAKLSDFLDNAISREAEKQANNVNQMKEKPKSLNERLKASTAKAAELNANREKQDKINRNGAEL